MNETRIRWERNDDGATVTAAWEGSIGKIDEASFWIFEPTDSEPWWILTSSLPGQGQYRVHNDEAEALKQHAERWLSEFVSSLGAVFPDESRVSVNREALDAFISEADAYRSQCDGEFCVGRAEFEASDAEFTALVAALDIAPGEPAKENDR
jgi:hypothetical protein